MHRAESRDPARTPGTSPRRKQSAVSSPAAESVGSADSALRHIRLVDDGDQEVSAGELGYEPLATVLFTSA